MTKRLRDKIASIFSVLPDPDARDAIRETLKTFRLSKNATVSNVKWADFTNAGSFLRGGLASTSGLSVHLVASAEEDADLAAMAAQVRDGGIEAGRIMRDRDADRFFWFVPAMSSAMDELPHQHLKGIVVSEALFGDVVQYFNPGRPLTPAEKRIAYQITAGLSLREAAALDATSIETKRSQIKSACAKMQCAGQTDLVRTLVGQMFHLVAISDAETAQTGLVERFIARHFASDVSLNVERLPNGHLIPYFEAGPADGTPLLIVHGMMFGAILQGLNAQTARLGLRAIMPVRPGYLQSFSIGSHYAEGGLVDRTISDLAVFAALKFDGPVAVLGQSLGAGLALNLARAYPQLVSSLMLVSTNLTQTLPTSENFAGHLYTGMRELSDYPGLSRLVTWQFRKHYADPKSCHDILANLFAACENDLRVLRGDDGRPAVETWFSDIYASSVTGIAEDFHFTMERLPGDTRPLSAPITFVHGEHDPLTRIAEIRRLAATLSGASVVELPDAGHFAIASHPETAWDAIAASIHRRSDACQRELPRV